MGVDVGAAGPAHLGRRRRADPANVHWHPEPRCTGGTLGQRRAEGRRVASRERQDRRCGGGAVGALLGHGVHVLHDRQFVHAILQAHARVQFHHVGQARQLGAIVVAAVVRRRLVTFAAAAAVAVAVSVSVAVAITVAITTAAPTAVPVAVPVPVAIAIAVTVATPASAAVSFAIAIAVAVAVAVATSALPVARAAPPPVAVAVTVTIAASALSAVGDSG